MKVGYSDPVARWAEDRAEDRAVDRGAADRLPEAEDPAADVFRKAENGRPDRRGVAADSFEYRTAVTHHVREDVDGGILPADEAAVMPYFFGGREHRLIITRLILRFAGVVGLCQASLGAGVQLADI